MNDGKFTVEKWEAAQDTKESAQHIPQQTNGAEPSEITPYWVCEKCTTVNGLDKVKCLGCGKVRAA